MLPILYFWYSVRESNSCLRIESPTAQTACLTEHIGVFIIQSRHSSVFGRMNLYTALHTRLRSITLAFPRLPLLQPKFNASMVLLYQVLLPMPGRVTSCKQEMRLQSSQYLIILSRSISHCVMRIDGTMCSIHHEQVLLVGYHMVRDTGLEPAVGLSNTSAS